MDAHHVRRPTLQQIKLILSDFDGTLTFPSHRLESELHRKLFDIFDFSEHHQKELIIISGRPLSWGHFFLSHFPINKVILEGGGVLLSREEASSHSSRKRSDLIKEECLVNADHLLLLEETEKELLQTFPHLKLSYDSWGRKTDRAVDLSQLSQHLHHQIEDFLQKKDGIQMTTSSIHLNFWAGDVSKYHGLQYLLRHYYPHVSENECLYFGDALNDQSMFAHLTHTVGVSNIMKDLPKMTHHPRHILQGDHHAGPLGVHQFLLSLG